MRGDKIRHARKTALQLVKVLKDVDYFSLLSFNHHVNWVTENALIGSQRKILQQQINSQVGVQHCMMQ